MATGELNIPSTVKDPHYRYKMPKIQITTQGSGNGIKTNWVNLPEVSNALKVPLDYPIKFIARELGSNTDTKSNSYLINGSHDVEKMQELLDKFIRKYVLCPKCKLPEIHGKVRVEKKKGKIKCTCRSCGTTSELDNTHNFASYIRSYPPPYEEEAKITNDNQEKPTSSHPKVKIDKKLIKAIRECCLNIPSVLKDDAPMEKNIEEINKFIEKYNFDLQCKFYCFSFAAFPDEIYTKTFLNRLPLIKHFIENESDNKPEEALYNLIIGFQDKIFSRQKGEKQKYVSSVLYYLYDKDILTEDFWLKYLKGNIQEKYSSIFRLEEGEKKLKEAAKDFSDWIENGPYEGEEENKENKEEKEDKTDKNDIKEEEKENTKEEKDEDDNEEKGKKKGKKKKGKKKKDKEKEKDDKNNDKEKDVKEETKEETKEEKKEETKEEPKEEKKEEKKEEEDINIDDI